jgi:cardiolipin synthase
MTRAEEPTPAPPDPPIATKLHTLVLLPEVEHMLRAILADVERARSRVYFECYIFVDDTLGRMIGEALARAAQRGVPVRLLIDPLGSQQADGTYFDDLRARGVDVRAYRRHGMLLGESSFAPRDHSRIMVVDDAGYTGGAAWSDEWLPEAWGGGGWHDVCVRVEGPCVSDFLRAFEQRWHEAQGGDITPRDIDTQGAYPDVRLVADTTHRESLVYLCHREAIARAKTRVWMENAYFFPSIPLLHDLYEAAARGVDVQIMLPGESDLPIMKRAALSEYAAWLDHGLVLWEYRGFGGGEEPEGPGGMKRRIMHSKIAVIDDDWCTIGTFNANPSSLALANEVNLFVSDPAFVARVARLFEEDRTKCQRVTKESTLERSLLDRVGDALANNAVTLLDVAFGPTRDEDPPRPIAAGEGSPEHE